MEIKYCMYCHNAIHETINDKPYLYCRIRKEYVGFYWKPCGEYKQMKKIFMKIACFFNNYWYEQYDRMFKDYKFLEKKYEDLELKYERLQGTIQRFENRKQENRVNEFEKVIISLALLIGLCIGFFFAGYFFCDRQATRKLEQANNELKEQQLKYDELIRTTETRIRESEDRIRAANQRVSEIREQLFKQISDNGSAITELSAIVEQIKKQRISL